MLVEVMMSPDRERTLLERCLDFVDGNRSILADDDYPVCIGCAGSLVGGEEHHANCNTFDLYIALRDAVKAEREQREAAKAMKAANTFKPGRCEGRPHLAVRGSEFSGPCRLDFGHDGECKP